MRNNNNSTLNIMYNFLQKKEILILSFVGTVILTLILNRIEYKFAGSSGAGNFALQFAFTKTNFEMVLAAWGTAGIELFIKSMWIDLLYIISYTTLFLSAPIYFHNLRNKKFSIDETFNIKLMIVPLGACLFDLIENIFHIVILTQRFFYEKIIFLSSLSSSLKFIFFIASLVIILIKYFKMRKT